MGERGRRAPAFPRPRRPGGCGRRRVPRTKRGERGARLLPREPAASREEAGWEGRHRRPAGSDAPRARRSWSLAPRLRRQPALEGEPRGLRRLKCVRTDPGFSPGRARPPPGCRAARLVAPETGRRRTLRHRLARTGSAPHQPRPASRPKPPPRASRTRLFRACPIHRPRCRPTSRRLMSAPLCRAGCATIGLFMRGCQGLFHLSRTGEVESRGSATG